MLQPETELQQHTANIAAESGVGAVAFQAAPLIPDVTEANLAHVGAIQAVLGTLPCQQDANMVSQSLMQMMTATAAKFAKMKNAMELQRLSFEQAF